MAEVLDEAAIGVVGMGRLDEQVEALADVGHCLGPGVGVEVPGVECLEQEVTDLAGRLPGPRRLLLDHLVTATEQVGHIGASPSHSGCTRPTRHGR